MSLQQEWQSQTESPLYQQSSDSEREAMRNEFFDTRVAPGFYPADRGRARELFDDYCLLYTSPSPRDRTRSRMPSSA